MMHKNEKVMRRCHKVGQEVGGEYNGEKGQKWRLWVLRDKKMKSPPKERWADKKYSLRCSDQQVYPIQSK